MLTKANGGHSWKVTAIQEGFFYLVFKYYYRVLFKQKLLATVLENSWAEVHMPGSFTSKAIS
jgi:hypothetical protein